MKVNKSVVTASVTAAIITCIATNTVRDLMYINSNGKIMRKLSAVVEAIKDYSIYEPEDDFLADMAATAAAVSVDDPYTRYFDADSYRQYVDSTSSSYFGIGVTLSSDYETGIVTVSECSAGGPSERSGVKTGDILTGVDELECSADNVSEVISYIKSRENGETVTLHIDRSSEKLDIAVPLETIQNILVSGQMIDSATGYIKINSFESSTNSEARTAYDDFMDTLNSLRDSGMTQIVIDLRDNPGGDLNVVTKIVDEFLDEGVITYTEDKNGSKNYIYANKGGMDYPVAIITNGSSASASEVMTSALKDNGKAIVVGEKTYGKGIVQRTFPFADGSGMTVTVARYYTPANVCIHGIGIEPDIECTLPAGTSKEDYTVENDPQIAKAVEVLYNN